MSKTHRQPKAQKWPEGFDKSQWARLNDTKIYESVEWDNNEVIDESIIPEVEWGKIDWKTVQRQVFKFQKLIFNASSRGEFSKMREYQRLLTKSYHARILAVRRVTEDNQGKKTVIDGVKNLTPKQRFILAEMLTKSPKKPKPTRRVWISQPDGEQKRLLGLPTVYDRALQCLHKMALEPEWEARFEANSYGFRPGKAAQDAIEAIYTAIKQQPKYVLDANIAISFNRINHKVLLDKIGLYPGRKLIAGWLKAWVYDDEQHQETKEGTTQSEIIRPLLANIALHGIEEVLEEYATKIPEKAYSKTKGDDERSAIPSRRKNCISSIGYAGNFVILHENLDILLEAKAIIEKWLQPIGLELEPSKTRIAHTLYDCEKESPGFDFLEFNVRQYPDPRQERGYKTLIKPSKKAVNTHYDKLKNVFDSHKSAPVKVLISKLNPIIREWCNYHKYNFAKETFSKLDMLVWKRTWRWCTRRHPTKSKSWVKDKYFAPNGTRNWELHDGSVKLIFHADTAMERYVKVKGNKSPYDGDTTYWAARMGNHPEMPTTKAKLLKKQEGRCALCGLPFGHEDLIEIDHIKPKAKGAKDCTANYQAVHRHCRDNKTAIESVGCTPDTREAPDAAGVARPVLKTN